MKKIFLGSFLTLFLAVGTVNADIVNMPEAGMLPNSPFYFLETLSEKIGMLFTFGKIKEAERYLELAGERLAESKALADEGDTDQAEKTAEKYQEQIDEALTKTTEAKTEGENIDAVLEKIAGMTARHQTVLANVYEKVPEQAKEAIQKVMEKSARGHDEALSAVSGEKQQEVRDRVKKDTKDDEDNLEDLRKLGLPIPEMNEGEDDLMNEVREMEPKDLDSGMMEETIKLENELR